MRNLLANAARHVQSAVIATLEEAETGVTLTVTGDGPGIPPDQQGRIFERFTRLDNARTRGTGGTGLGLAVTNEVVTAHGGTITPDNAPGARFTVSFLLPSAP